MKWGGLGYQQAFSGLNSIKHVLYEFQSVVKISYYAILTVLRAPQVSSKLVYYDKSLGLK